MVISHLRHLFVERSMESICILLLPRFLLLFRHFLRPQIRLQLPFPDAMFILPILQGDYCLLLQRGQLIGVLEHEMHQPLHVDLDLDLVFFFQVLVLALFVAQFGLLIFKLLLTNHPEITDTDALVVIHVGELVFVLYLFFEFTAL